MSEPPAFLSKFDAVRDREHDGWLGTCPRHTGFGVVVMPDEKTGRYTLTCLDDCSESWLQRELGITDADLSMNGSGPARRPRLTLIGDVEMRRIEWIEQDLIARGMLTGLVAPGGTVKGLYGVHLAAKLAERGEKTLFLCSEDALNYIVRPRFEAAGCDGRLAQALDVETPTGATNLRFPSDTPILAEAISVVEPTLVLIDPFAGYLDTGINMGRNNQVRWALQPLIDLAGEADNAIVPVYHSGKDPTKGALESVAFEDACRFVLTAAKDDEDPDVRHVELTKTVAGRTGYGRKLRIVEVPLEIEGETVGVAKLVDEGRSNKSVADLMRAAKRKPGPDPTQRDQAKVALTEILVAAAGESVNADDARQRVMAETGASTSTAFRAFTELKDAGLAGASPERDEHGSITEWRWYAKQSLLVGRGDA
jgi:AAA domain